MSFNQDVEAKEDLSFVNPSLVDESANQNLSNFLTSSIKPLMDVSPESENQEYRTLLDTSDDRTHYEARRKYREKNFECTASSCKKRYVTESALLQHIKVKHPEIDYPVPCLSNIANLKDTTPPKKLKTIDEPQVTLPGITETVKITTISADKLLNEPMSIRKPTLVASTSMSSLYSPKHALSPNAILTSNSSLSSVLMTPPTTELEIALTKRVRELEFENQRLAALLELKGTQTENSFV